MKTTAERLKEGMELRKMKQADLVQLTGISKGALSSYLSGRYAPKQDNVFKLAAALNVSEAWLMGADVPMKRTPSLFVSDDDILQRKKGTAADLFPEEALKELNKISAVRIPVLGKVPAGIPIEEIEDVIGYEEITNKLAERGEYFALKVTGDSMEPKIHDEDVVIVRCQPDAENGDVVIATVNGCDGTCKRLKKTDTGLMLLPFNSSYDPYVFTWKEVEEMPVVIIGKVIEARSKF